MQPHLIEFLIFPNEKTDCASEVLTFLIMLEVIFVKDMLFALLAVISVIVAGYFLYTFQTSANPGSSSLIIGVVFVILAFVFGGLFMFGRVNRHEDIHITE
ncbi:MAG: hypothetical protein M3T96_02255 [Acidobacteriota bacterium]|nr:hypothetical protein [Acidobacteriota bacterium]